MTIRLLYGFGGEQYMNLGKAGAYYGDPKAGGILVQDIDRGFYFGK